jgi:predicted permease
MLPEGVNEEDTLRWPEIDTVVADAGYFETLGIHLLRGRGFRVEDHAEAPGVVVVNEEFARRFWPGQDAIGKEVRMDSEGPASEVVGVVATGRYRTLGEAPRPFLYTSFRQDYSSMMTLVAVGDIPEGELLAGLRSAIDRVDPHLPIFDVTTLGEHTDLMLFPSRLAASLLGVFGLLGLLLAAVGLYGVVAFSVARRTREVGVRRALGARRGQVVAMILREGLTLVAVGLAVGLGIGWLASGVFEGLLFGITPGDPLTYVLVAGVLFSIAGLANFLPARRAAAAAPTEALRYE